MFKIEKNVPMDRGGPGKYKAAAEAIASMEVGNSFVFPSKSAPASLHATAKAIGRNISIRKIGDGQYRIFRTE